MFKDFGQGTKDFLKPDQIMNYVKDMKFPTNKQYIISTLRSKKAPEQIIQAAYKLPDKTYNSPQEFVDDLKGMIAK